MTHLTTLRKAVTSAIRQLDSLTDEALIADSQTIEDFADIPPKGQEFVAVIQLFVNVVSSADSFLRDNADEAKLAENLLSLDLGDTKLSKQEESLLLALVALKKFVAWAAGGDAKTFDTNDVEEII